MYWPNESQIRVFGKPNAKPSKSGIVAVTAKTIARQRNATTQSTRIDAATRLSEIAIPKNRAVATAQSHFVSDSVADVDLTRARIPPTIARSITLSKWAAPAKVYTTSGFHAYHAAPR